MFLIGDLVSPRTWLAMIHHLAGLVLGTVVLLVVLTGICWGVLLLPFALIGLPVLGVTLRFADAFARAERVRFGFLLGTQIPAWPAIERAGYRLGIVPRLRMLRDRAAWSEVGYALLRFPVSAFMAAISLVAWSVALVMLTLPFYNQYLPSGGVQLGGMVVRGAEAMVLSGVGGFVLLMVAAQLTRVLAAADAGLTRLMLGPPTDLAARVSELEISRERVVDAAEAERRRIERTCTTAPSSDWSR